jgi:hypothetical protein
MLRLKTAKNVEIPINWIGISDFDGSLRFETTETNLAELFMIFNDPEHTICLTRVFDEAEKDFEGFTSFKGIERMSNGCTVIRLNPGLM